jgi:hypothetical protein
VGKGPIHSTARKPGPLEIIHYSLLHTDSGKITREKGRRLAPHILSQFQRELKQCDLLYYSCSILSLLPGSVSPIPSSHEDQEVIIHNPGSVVAQMWSATHHLNNCQLFTFIFAMSDIRRGQERLSKMG